MERGARDPHLRISIWGLACIAALVFGTAGVNWTYHNHVVDKLETLVDEDIHMMTSTWTSGGIEHSITTTQLSGEGVDAFIARHKAAVEAAMEAFPPDA